MPADENPFDVLLDSLPLQNLSRGRQGNVLVRTDESGDVPIVRTTTPYSLPAQRFRAVHERLAEQIGRRAGVTVPFNNALIERYTRAYASMKSHSDQAMDLAEGSCIAVFSCYRSPQDPSRHLIVEPKEAGRAFSEIPLAHCSVILFSLETNRRFRHKIVLRAGAPESEWLGITLRTSKTFVRFCDDGPCLRDGTPLTLADDEQRHAFLKLRRRENDEVDFAYPPLSYTLSESDRMQPLPLEQSRLLRTVT